MRTDLWQVIDTLGGVAGYTLERLLESEAGAFVQGSLFLTSVRKIEGNSGIGL